MTLVSLPASLLYVTLSEVLEIKEVAGPPEL
jgi:hypothetical protein